MRGNGMKWLLAVLLLCVCGPLLAEGVVVSPQPGEVPPALPERDGKGQPLSWDQHRGKVVIVTFWASWCGPCRRELPMLGKLQKVVGRDHLEVIAINLKEPRRDYLAVIRANRDLGLTWVHDARGEAAQRYGVTAIPHMFMVDRDGIIANVHRGYSAEMLDGFLQEIMAMLPPEVLNRPAGGGYAAPTG